MQVGSDLSPDSKVSVFNLKANRRLQKEFIAQHEHDRAYIHGLEELLHEKGVEIPDTLHELKKKVERRQVAVHRVNALMADGSLDALAKSTELIMQHTHRYEIAVQYRNLTFWNMLPKLTIPTVGSTFMGMFLGGGKKERVNIINDLTGRILPKRMTLVMGPPGCGKTTFLKALAGQLTVGSAHLEGEILYNGDPIDCGKYLVGKLAAYSDEKEQHAGPLTVRETLEFAWKMTTAGHHSYGIAKDPESAAFLNQDDKHLVQVNNIIKILGLSECADTLVGDAMLRGVSGGQKRRVTLGEMLLPPRTIRFLDAISNGLDAATTYDIVQSLKFITNTFGSTTVISLLQPAPDVFYSFTDVIVMADGQIIYHGPTTSVLDYFQDLGYQCPEIMDVADYLQEIPTVDGKRFTIGRTTKAGGAPPLGTDALVQAWKSSTLFQAMMEEMDVQVKESTGKWPAEFNEPYPSSFWYTLTHCLERETKLITRNTPFLIGRGMQSVVVGAIAGSLFNGLAVDDSNSMSGILFFSALFGALSAMSMLPVIFEQRNVFYKLSKGMFYDTPTFVLAQTLVMYPLMILETISFTTIIYWSVGLSDDYHSSRYWTFMFVVFVFSLAVSQFYRLVASVVSTDVLAQPIGGTALVLMVLFSGFIIPKSNIPPGWEWFYWINPIAYVLRAVTINEFLAPDYDFLTCGDAACTTQVRFGDLALTSKGNPTDQKWVWYSVAILLAMYAFFLVLTTLALTYIRNEPVPPPPIVVDYSAEQEVEIEKASVEIPFEPATFSFKDVWYTVTLPSGEELDLLRGVSGYCEPGTVTALMGSSGAGKTTLLDVLSGRKNTGIIKGGIYVNGKLKNERAFMRSMGYVEQFDSLSPNDTTREAVEFSAALRLPRDTPADIRVSWVTTVLTMLELLPLENTLVGSAASGGMSFEQKKRVSIAVELAANPAILFLDEPTSGLDSRSAQVVIRCIKRVAASGRSIVCTIHQPSAVIFDAFDSLLLLKRGGQTVFFGDLGEHSANLIEYFESIDGVEPKGKGVNPATWMLECIGAGTAASTITTDFHAVYKQSTLCDVNSTKINILCPDNNGSDDDEGAQLTSGVQLTSLEEGNGTVSLKGSARYTSAPLTRYNATYWVQFSALMKRFLLSYWRSPEYNFVRMMISVVISLIFSSAYSDQKYSNDVDVISRVALIFITVLFMGVVGMMTVLPVIFAERPAFYREQYSEIYDVKLYTLAGTLVEFPYLIMSSVIFVIPYFFIIGFDKGDVAAKFFWYWLFQGLYMSTSVFFGHLLCCSLPNAETANVLGGMCITLFSLFCGFMIVPANFPDFWIFMYWLDPLHYVLEGLVTTQFNRDHTLVTITGTTTVTTAQGLIESFYDDWHYSARGYDIMALCLFLIFNRIVAYFALSYIRHDKR